MPGDVPGVRSLSDYVVCFDGALEQEFCAQLIASFQQMAHLHTRNGRGVRPALERSGWTELNVSRLADEGFKGFFLQQIDRYLALYNERVRLTIPVPTRPAIEDLRIKRYRAGADEQFQPHFDSIDAVANRYLVFLWYLNDVADGGETEFCDLGVKVSARTGRLLMFPPYWLFQHAGLPPRSNDKYILSTYLLF
ncbi:2OG-Fe(II) oxygenase [Dokdonella sp.]|uniref:2OG-Fe(II) oxygenase n=1 Tax=Dokdonella sp. TaxID=2291710 RepID=UPI001B25CD24|nr:2OG-Fe(II) oxygenase [Dokdonella sp.]MBO9665178.1 2OG-Fe(II) oxygenase [Dokdonella sp.]